MGNMVFNERLKLRANFANNVGIALLLSIAIAPMVATDHGLPLWQEVLLFFLASRWHSRVTWSERPF